jgi:NAD(P)-dependent dehydrogenase (short-subunit alcohol dehydrogenase family)
MAKSILITGCSSGIGLCAATTLHKRGYRVFATVRQESDAQPLQAEGIETILMDVDDSASITQGLTTVLEKTGGTLDALFNNAGYAIPGAVEDMTRAMLRKQFETNVFGPTELLNLVIPVMRQQGYGRIIQNTSILGVVTMPYRGAYNASKFALEALTSTLRQELRDVNIQVSIIAPGPIQTRFRDNANKSYQENLKGKDSVHQTVYKNMEKYFAAPPEAERRFTVKPEVVVSKLIHALESSSPRARYYAGFPAHLLAFLRRILPDAGLDWIIAQTMRGESR